MEYRFTPDRRRFLLLAAGTAAAGGLAGCFEVTDLSISPDSPDGEIPPPTSPAPASPTTSTDMTDATDPSSVPDPENNLPDELTDAPSINDAAEEELASETEAGTFTRAEFQKHRAVVGDVSVAAATYLDNVYRMHTEFHAEHAISKYFGNRNPAYQTRAGRVQEIETLGGYTTQEASAIADMQEPTACILLTMRALEHGFDEVGMASTWAKIHNKLAIDNKFLGTDLQIMLQELGWKIYYWNPDPSQNAAWDAEDEQLNPLKAGRVWNPVWGGHAIRYNNVHTKKDSQGRGIYDLYGPGVDDSNELVGFGTTAPPALTKAPFFVGIAHAGYHVFPGSKGEVIEAHSMRKLDDISNIEVSEFNPLAGGAPRWTNSEKYRSGLIAVPFDL